jgi:hypothetical protein
MSRIVHFELSTKNRTRAKTFYEKVFDWTFQDVPGIDYTLIETGNEGDPGINGGFFSEEDHAQNVINTIDIKNIDDVIKKVQDAGGTVTVPKTSMAGIGYLCYIKDTEGNIMGVMESDPSAL